MMHKAGDVAVAVLVVAGLFVVTRPGSEAADVLRSLLGGFAGLVQAATGQAAPARPPRRTRGTR